MLFATLLMYGIMQHRGHSPLRMSWSYTFILAGLSYLQFFRRCLPSPPVGLLKQENSLVVRSKAVDLTSRK